MVSEQRIAVALLLVALASLVFGPYVVIASSEAPAKADGGLNELRPETVGSATQATGEGYTSDEVERMRSTAKKYEFQAEVNRLMQIIINSLYSSKEIFLRELISNASDALDKIRFLALTNPALLGEGDMAQLGIRIKLDKASNELHIIDTGVGMTRKELVENLGTIAQSGTKGFVERIAAAGSEATGSGAVNDFIGQFGVGFYSAYLVADRVTVTTKHNDDVQLVWESDSAGSYTIAEDPRGNTLGRGTRVTLHLKEDSLDLLEEARVTELVVKYSEFINFPISLWSSRTEEVVDEAATAAAAAAAKEAKEDAVESDGDDDDDDNAAGGAETEVKPKTKTVVKYEWKLLNQNKPIWTRSPSDISDAEYQKFYTSISRGLTDPIGYTHFSGEGEVDFRALLFVPAEAPSGQFDATTRAAQRGLKLYVRKVFITDNFDDLIPAWLAFLRGVVDSDDLPLNVSREILQQARALQTIRKKLVRKAIAMFQKMSADEPEKFERFYAQYSTNLKLGVIEDQHNRVRLAKLLRFHTTRDAANTTTLGDYVERMPEKQEEIFYLAGETIESLRHSPLVERLHKRGVEVLLLTEPIDEYMMGQMGRFDNKYKLTNVAKEGLKFDDDDELDADAQKALDEQFKPLTALLGQLFAQRVTKVVLSRRLTSSPAALVSSSAGWSANMEKLFKLQAQADKKMAAAAGYLGSRRVLELNPRHPLILELNQRAAAADDSTTLAELAHLLYDSVSLQSGYELDNGPEFAQRVFRLLNSRVGLAADAAAAELPEKPAKQPEVAQKDEL